MITLRTAAPEDRSVIIETVRAAFDSDEEVQLVKNVWAAPEYLPSLELVAEKDGMIVGHVLHSTGYVGDRLAVALAPLAVHPAHQRTGVGTALMREGIQRADAEQRPLMILLGNPLFYGRFGFEPARDLGVTTDMRLRPGPDPFLALRLTLYDPSIRGLFKYCWDARR